METPIQGYEAPAELVARMRDNALRKAGLRGAYASADSAIGRDAYRRALDGRGTYLWGAPGTGKTHAAACAVRLAIEGMRRAELVTAQELLDGVKARYDDPSAVDVMRIARSLWLLALDDLGAERRTEWSMSSIEDLIDYRLVSGLPTIITSNFRLGELRDLWGGVDGARIASRIGGACERVHVDGPDRRLA